MVLISATGATVLTNYRFSNNYPGMYSLPFGVKYIASSGKGHPKAPNLLYGAGSAAWVQLVISSSGFAFGLNTSATNQTRVIIEADILYRFGAHLMITY